MAWVYTPPDYYQMLELWVFLESLLWSGNVIEPLILFVEVYRWPLLEAIANTQIKTPFFHMIILHFYPLLGVSTFTFSWCTSSWCETEKIIVWLPWYWNVKLESSSEDVETFFPVATPTSTSWRAAWYKKGHTKWSTMQHSQGIYKQYWLCGSSPIKSNQINGPTASPAISSRHISSFFITHHPIHWMKENVSDLFLGKMSKPPALQNFHRLNGTARSYSTGKMNHLDNGIHWNLADGESHHEKALIKRSNSFREPQNLGKHDLAPGMNQTISKVSL